jgi:AraC family transcriptional regulator
VVAPRLLTQPGTPVLEIALTVGFGSSEAFARACKQRFGFSPSGCRQHEASERDAQRRNLDQVRRKPDQADRKLDQAHPTRGRDDGIPLVLVARSMA